MDPSQRSYLVVSTSHDNSIKPDNRVFIILGDFILIKSAGTLFHRCCALVQRCVSPTGSCTSRSTRLNSRRDTALDWNIEPFLGMHFHDIPLSLIPVARKKISNVTLQFIMCTLLIKISSATFHSTTCKLVNAENILYPSLYVSTYLCNK